MHRNRCIKKLLYVVATVGGLGYSPYAPGTVGSIAAVIAFWFLQEQSKAFLVFSTLILFFIGVFAAGFVAMQERRKDPSIVVIDELVGMWLTLLSTLVVPYYISSSFLSYFLLFLLFRFFDITKPYPIKQFEQLSGGWGIMIDDVIAAVYAVIAALISCYIYSC